MKYLLFNKRWLFVLLGVALLSGCASPARIGMMRVDGNPLQRIQQTPLRGMVSIQDVTGGQDTNPLWTSKVSSVDFKNAMEESLKAVGLYAPTQLGKYRLTAHLESLDQPLFGASLTVTARVNYVLYEQATGKNIYSRKIELPYTAKAFDALLATERLRLANEGAIRVKIKQLIDDLFALNIGNIATGAEEIKMLGNPAAQEFTATSKPQAAITTETSTAENTDITQTVREWAMAWSSKDIDSYLASYSQKFPNRDEWMKQRQKALGKDGQIRISLTGIKVTAHDGDRANVTFMQDYWSQNYQDRVQKTLSLQKEGGTWKIVKESVY